MPINLELVKKVIDNPDLRIEWRRSVNSASVWSEHGSDQTTRLGALTTSHDLEWREKVVPPPDTVKYQPLFNTVSEHEGGMPYVGGYKYDSVESLSKCWGGAIGYIKLTICAGTKKLKNVEYVLK